MPKYLLALLTSAAVLSRTALPALAEENQGGMVIVQSPHHPHQEEIGQSGSSERGGMMGGGMMDRMMGTSRPGTVGTYAPPMHSIAMHIIFALMDSDGDGTISLQEFQAAHERLFKAMDSNKDGHLSLGEMQSFMHGSMGARQAR